MLWQIEQGVRCDMVCYSARNLSGKRSQIRVFPGGNRKGDLPAGQLRSMIVRAPYGIRVILIADPGPNWEASPWRCIRVLEAHSLLSDHKGMPGIRIPDLALLDSHEAKKTDDFMESSYPMVERLADGTDWTFGRTGDLNVKLIRVERDRVAVDSALPPADALAREIWRQLCRREPDRAQLSDVAGPLQRVLVDAGELDATRRVREFEQWAETCKLS